jgi:anti-sigma-K factor RskA
MKHLQAFEYVLGTLSGRERSEFQQQLKNDRELQQQVYFWEEQLMAIQSSETRQPSRDMWQNILRRINAGGDSSAESSRTHHRSLWRWLIPGGALAIALALAVLLGYQSFVIPATPSADYVAILSNTEGQPRLTVITSGDNKKMWLYWEDITLPTDSSVQLWAVSRRDGATRSIAVFDTPDDRQLILSQAHWRLIQDAEFLLLTQEEAGGSPLDEPGAILLGKGICVRLSPG